MKALVDAILSSLPAFKNIPHFSSRAIVDSTLLTMFSLYIPSFPAVLNGPNKSVVSPDWVTAMKPPLKWGKSCSYISEAILTSTESKQPKSLIKY